MHLITIRMAVSSDWEVIAEFNMKLAAETEGKILDPTKIQNGVRTLLSDSRHGCYFVALLENKIVGQMMHTREWSDWRNGEIWWLQSVFVDPDFRRRGVFRALYRHLEELAEQTTGVVGIRLYVENSNVNAQDTYRTLGLKSSGYTVMEKLFQN